MPTQRPSLWRRTLQEHTQPLGCLGWRHPGSDDTPRLAQFSIGAPRKGPSPKEFNTHAGNWRALNVSPRSFRCDARAAVSAPPHGCATPCIPQRRNAPFCQRPTPAAPAWRRKTKASPTTPASAARPDSLWRPQRCRSRRAGASSRFAVCPLKRCRATWPMTLLPSKPDSPLVVSPGAPCARRPRGPAHAPRSPRPSTTPRLGERRIGAALVARQELLRALNP